MKAKRILCLFCAVILAALCFSGCAAQKTEKAFVEAKDFNDAKIGVLTGSNFEGQTQKKFPDSEKLRFDTLPDLLINTEQGRIDGFLIDEAVFAAICWERDGFKAIGKGDIAENEFAYITADTDMGRKINSEINEFILYMNESGEAQKLAEKWFSDKRPQDTFSYDELKGLNGTIKVAVETESLPFAYQSSTKACGYDVEYLIMFAEKYGYKLDITTAEGSAVLAGISTQKYDIALAGLVVTPERREEYTFTDPYYRNETVMVVKDTFESETTLSSMSDSKIAIVTGTMTAVLVPKLIPDAEYMEYNSVADAAMALSAGKVDAFPTDESIYIAMLWEGRPYDRIDEPIAPSDYGVIFTKDLNEALQAQFNGFLADKKASGELLALEEKWFSDKEPVEFMDYENLEDVNGTLRIGINSTSKPFTYIKNGKYAGFDIELVTMFAKECGYGIKFEDALFASVLTGVSAGTYDMGVAGFTITEERAESVDFSDVYHTEDLVLVVNKTDDVSEAKTFDDFKTAKIGVLTGSYTASFIYKMFPDAEIFEYNNISDMALALLQGKIDASPNDESYYVTMKWEGKAVERVAEPIERGEYGIIFKKGENVELRNQFNEFLAKAKADGTMDALEEKWFSDAEPTEFLTTENLTGENGTIVVASVTDLKPFGYIKNGTLAGFDIEVMTLFAQEYGYDLKFEEVAFASIIVGVESGTYDIGAAGFTITDERRESVDFSDVYHTEDIVLIYGVNQNDEGTFAESIKGSFEKTFIREARWKLIAEGIGVTLIISVFSVIGGTLVGFGLYMLSRSKRKALSKIARGFSKVYSRIIAGMPTLVVLMILFYVVFASADVSGIIVAIVGFTLTFGAFVYDNLAVTVDGVDRGQTEAAYALGYSRNKTFFRIVLPQALKIFIPAYIGEIIGLVKATSIVGYIAVNDLTKMGDIIRGNTYEAFFPLIAVAAIYFIITWIIASLLGILKRKSEPKKRKNKDILKGVVR